MTIITWLVGLVVGVTREPMLFGYGSDSSSSMPACASPLARAGVFIVFSSIGIRSSSPILQIQTNMQMSYAVSKRKVIHGPESVERRWSPIQRPQPDTSWSCKTRNTGLVCHEVCRFTSPLSPVPYLILFGDRGTWVWTTCIELLPDSHSAGNNYKRSCDVQVGSRASVPFCWVHRMNLQSK